MENNMSPTIGKLAEALNKAQKVIEGAKKDSENPYFHSDYADLSSVWEACRKPLTDNGLSVVQTMESMPGYCAVTTTLLHVSGEWIRGTVCMTPVKQDPQAMGSAITYARRYSLAAIVGVCPLDDDGNGASDKEPPKQPIKEPIAPIPIKPAPAAQTPVEQPTGGSTLDFVAIGQPEADEIKALCLKKGIKGKNLRPWLKATYKCPNGVADITVDIYPGVLETIKSHPEMILAYGNETK